MKRFPMLVLAWLALVAFASAQFTFTSIDFPGGTLTSTRGINNHGDIVGAYRINPPRHALLIKDRNFIPLAQTTVLGTNYSDAFKSNDRGNVVGEFIGDDGFTHGFLLRQGVVTTLDFPGASDTFAFGINESGTVVGYWDLLDAGGNVLAYHGFTWNKGAFTQVDFPGSVDSAVLGINARGDLVGDWDPGITSPIAHGFVCSHRNCFSFDVPGANITQANDINARGQVVGTYINAAGEQHAFLAAGAEITSFDFPGAVLTAAWGINSAGQIVGDYRNADNVPHGFLVQPGHKSKP
jgi:probable HAF family extracellular repeat protein